MYLHLGDELLQREGTTKITREIFPAANDKRQNAQIFLENLEKLSSKQKGDDIRQFLTKALNEGPSLNGANSLDTRGDVDSLSVDNSSGNFKIDLGSFRELTLNRAGFSDTELNSEIVSEKVINKEEVLINISPKKYEQAKDQLFLDFFKMYTKRSLKDGESVKSKGTTQIKLTAHK